MGTIKDRGHSVIYELQFMRTLGSWSNKAKPRDVLLLGYIKGLKDRTDGVFTAAELAHLVREAEAELARFRAGKSILPVYIEVLK